MCVLFNTVPEVLCEGQEATGKVKQAISTTLPITAISPSWLPALASRASKTPPGDAPLASLAAHRASRRSKRGDPVEAAQQRHMATTQRKLILLSAGAFVLGAASAAVGRRVL